MSQQMRRRRGVKLDEPGGKTVTVQILVNGKLTFSRACTLVRSGRRDKYVTSTGAVLRAPRDDVYAIAKKLL